MKLELEKTWDFPVVAESVETVGLKAEVRAEEYIEEWANPRTSQTNLGFMLCAHPDYLLGDEQVRNGIDTAVTCERCDGAGYNDERFVLHRSKGYGYERVASGSEAAMEAVRESLSDDRHTIIEEDTCEACDGEGEVRLGFADFFRVKYGATVVLPLYLYDHSGISMSCGSNLLPGADEAAALSRRGRFMGDDAGWDTSTVGFIIDTRETRAETGAPLDDIERQLRGEVNEYDDYLRGSVYYWRVFDTETDDTIESCAGYLGDSGVDAAMEEAAWALKSERQDRINAKRRETINRQWALDREIVTVEA